MTDPLIDAPTKTRSDKPQVVVFDYGSGNVRSVVRALEAAGSDVTLTADLAVAFAADGLVVPGVGAFASVMRDLQAAGGYRLIERRLSGGKPVLGICVGMQVLFDSSDEHGIETTGLEQWPAKVTKLQADVVPHMGWNTVEVAEGSKLFAGIEQEHFYFVHSYGVQEWTFDAHASMQPPLVTWSDHGGKFIAAIENGPLCATQFHPEKSGEAGAQLLRNWLGSL